MQKRLRDEGQEIRKRSKDKGNKVKLEDEYSDDGVVW